MPYIKKRLIKHNFFNIIVVLLILLYTIVAMVVSLHRFWQYDAFHYDLGIFDAAIWRVSRFQAPIIDHLVVSGKWNFSDHFTPAVFLFSPLYWFTDKTEMLMVVQALCVGSGLLFGYLAIKDKLKNKLLQLVLISSFIFYIGMQNALIANFHPIVCAVLPLMICFWAINKEKWSVFWLALLFFLAFEEDNAVTGLALGIYIFLSNKKFSSVGIKTFILSFFYGIVTTQLVIPFFSGGFYYYSPNLNKPITDWLIKFIYPWEKLKTMLVSFASFGFLPLFSISMLPGLLLLFYSRFAISGGRDGLGLHYNALVAPLMFIASFEVAKRLERSAFKKYNGILGAAILGLSFLLNTYIFPGPLNLVYRKEFYENTKRHEFLDNFLKQVPTDGLIMAQNHLTPRFSHNNMMLIRDKYWLYWPKYIVLELRSGQNPNNHWPLTEEGTKEMVDNLKKDSHYQLMFYFNEEYIFKLKQ